MFYGVYLFSYGGDLGVKNRTKTEHVSVKPNIIGTKTEHKPNGSFPVLYLSSIILHDLSIYLK